jgi:hypothetical protein
MYTDVKSTPNVSGNGGAVLVSFFDQFERACEKAKNLST